VGIGHTELPQFLLQDVLVLCTGRLLLGWWQIGIRTGVGTCPLIERFDLREPLMHCCVVGVLFFEIMPIAQAMHEASLMEPLMDIVGGV